MKVYLDNAATTPVNKEVLKEMLPYLKNKFGNASSIHRFGSETREAVENARKKIAEFINVTPEEIIFTSGGTESNNLVIKGLALANPNKKHIITSKIEHPAVLEVCKEMEKKGYNVDYISVDGEGIVDVGEIKNKIKPDTLIVSIMHVNNETGSIQPIGEIAELCRASRVCFHTDAVQSFGKIKIDGSNFDFISASGHKINALKGVGILYVKKGLKIKPIFNGGGQERNIRSGTENVPGIVAFGKAVEIAEKEMRQTGKIKELRDRLIAELLKIDGTRLNGSKDRRIFNNVNVSFSDVEGEAVVLLLDEQGIASSTGSACSSHSLEPSQVLKAMGLNDSEAHSSLRLTLGWQNTKKEVDYTIQQIKKIVEKLRRIST